MIFSENRRPLFRIMLRLETSKRGHEFRRLCGSEMVRQDDDGFDVEWMAPPNMFCWSRRAALFAQLLQNHWRQNGLRYSQ